MQIINPIYETLEEQSPAFIRAEPFPHVVLDDFLDKDFYESLSETMIADPGQGQGRVFDTEAETNKWISLNVGLSDGMQTLLDFLNSEQWVAVLQEFSRVDSLVSTEHGNTALANYHEMGPGGFLAPHVDHAFEPETGLPHVLNIILYLSNDWNDEFGGATLFYDRKGVNMVQRIAYKPNRAVVFLHTPYSFHCVEEIYTAKTTRKSLYVDYYSRSFSPYENLDLSFPAVWFSHGTTFKLKGMLEYLKPKNIIYTKSLLKYKLNEFRSQQ